jgi:hypothetical protein
MLLVVGDMARRGELYGSSGGVGGRRSWKSRGFRWWAIRVF